MGHEVISVGGGEETAIHEVISVVMVKRLLYMK